jgi:hypothetical protein
MGAHQIGPIVRFRPGEVSGRVEQKRKLPFPRQPHATRSTASWSWRRSHAIALP